MKILIAPDKFKGSLSAKEVCLAIQAGLLETRKQRNIVCQPMADGGDGSLEVIADHINFEKVFIETVDPLGRPILSYYLCSKKRAFIELASASGLILLKQEERNPNKTSSFGTGLMIADAISKGCTEIFLFLGGSATNDGGMGIAEALGVQFLSTDGRLLKAMGENLSFVKEIILPKAFDVSQITINLLCDVNNPLYGPNGSAQVYAAQKGADNRMIKSLDLGLQHYAKILFELTGKDIANVSGVGAAGGIGASLMTLFNATIKSGCDALIEITDLEAKIESADLVISGEGKLDRQSLQGKVVDRISRLCKKYNKELVILTGKNELNSLEQEKLGANQVLAILDLADSLEDGVQNAAYYLQQSAKNIF